MNVQKYKTHIHHWISFGILGSFLFSLTGSFLPYQGAAQTLFFKIDGLFAICAFACLATKATSEGFDLVAAGFTVLAIAEGLFLTSLDQPDNLNDEVIFTGAFFMIPSFISITYYGKFPKWLHIAGILSTVPFIGFIIVHYSNNFTPGPILKYVVYLVYQIITLCWARQIWKQRK